MMKEVIIFFVLSILLLILNVLLITAIGSGYLPVWLDNIYFIAVWVFADICSLVLLLAYMLNIRN